MIANTINVGADLGADGDSLALIVGGPTLLYVLGFGLVTSPLQVWSEIHAVRPS